MGITNNMGRRQREHGDWMQIGSIGSGLSRGRARAIEPALIDRARRDGLNYLNKINSISPGRSYYDQAVAWGESWLRTMGR